ncbi:hypothetical protein TanjilG_13108 [Lupinus angustifolius]|uniref:F-box domain-containing protein n=1 Tax=Lupinus angustifolius TaxID=3871 RepID=A0A394DQ79_LUPAN|nr:hypothetical protein TanjilG_13108 [Lupinus angustifolius]
MEDPSKASSSLSLQVEQAQPESPHEALFLVLSYLNVYELLVMSQVCISLRDAVSNDVLPWLNLVVERPINYRLSDEILMKITSKANGRLKTLALINCVHITDQGLQRVIEQNKLISKLYIPSCTSITPEGVLRAVEVLCQGSHSLSSLRINGIYNIQKEHLDMLSFYLRKNQSLEEQQKKQPVYYHERGNLSVFEKNQRIIDLEICPMCFEVRMVYDCPKDALDCKKRKSVPVEITCALIVGYKSFLSAVSVTNHIVSNIQVGGATLQTLDSFVKFVKKILMDILTLMRYD